MHRANRGSISVIIPALNEEDNLAATISNVLKVVACHFQDWELLVFDDGSSDRTGLIADELAKKDPKIIVTHHPTPRNLGACYKEGIEKSSKDFLIMIPGDNECGLDVMESIFKMAGNADIIIPFTNNQEVRPVGRRVLSSAFTQLVNTISGCRLRYYNGAVLHKTELIKSIAIQTDSFGYQAEALVKLLRKGHTFEQVGIKITYRPTGKSKAFRIDNVIKVARFLSTLAVESRLAGLIVKSRKNFAV